VNPNPAEGISQKERWIGDAAPIGCDYPDGESFHLSTLAGTHVQLSFILPPRAGGKFLS
jgi:hypothetical protein